jgi:hypothetical protein
MTEVQADQLPARGDDSPRLTPNSKRSTVAGVGGGTGLVALAQSVIGADTTLGAVILYIAPAMSFVAGATLYYLEVQASRYLERRLVNNARKTLERQLDGNRTSNEHKARIRRKLEELEEAVASAELERVRLLRNPSAPRE